MEEIKVNGELLFEFSSKRDWVNRVPGNMPPKIRGGEKWIWIDKNGNNFECGADFSAAEHQDSYPCKVYRLQNISGVKSEDQL